MKLIDSASLQRPNIAVLVAKIRTKQREKPHRLVDRDSALDQLVHGTNVEQATTGHIRRARHTQRDEPARQKEPATDHNRHGLSRLFGLGGRPFDDRVRSKAVLVARRQSH